MIPTAWKHTKAGLVILLLVALFVSIGPEEDISANSNRGEVLLYIDPLYGYQFTIPTDWYVSPTAQDALFGAAVFTNYDPEAIETGNSLPSSALKIQIGVAPLPTAQTFDDWVSKWVDFEIHNPTVRSRNLVATNYQRVKVAAYSGVSFEIHDSSAPENAPYFTSILEVILQLEPNSIIVIGFQPANSTSIETGLRTLQTLELDSPPSFPKEILSIAEAWARAPTPLSPFTANFLSRIQGNTCNVVGTFPGNEAPNTPLTIYMPFLSGETWTVGGAGSFYGNWAHCNPFDDYYATDWNRSNDDGAAVLPIADGTVSDVQTPTCPNTSYGCFVQVDHASGIRTLYGHLSNVYVTSGFVFHYQQIGTVGNTGNSEGPHLHLRFQQNNGGYHSYCYNNGATCPNGDSPHSPQGPKPSPMQTANGPQTLIDGNSYTSNNGSSSPPSTPSGLSASTIDHDSIYLEWNDNSGNEDGFKIFRNGVQIATVGTNVESYTNNGLSCNTTYSYYVKAYNENGDSGASNTDSATTDSCSPPPTPNLASPPNGASFTSCSSVTLDWNASSGADDYDVEYWGASSGSNNTSQTDWNIGIRPPGSYSWRARANNEWGSSSWSSTWTFTVNSNAVPSTPTLLSPPDNGWLNSHDIPLAWQAANDDGCPNSLSYTVEIGSDTYSGIGGTTYTAHVNNDADYVWRARAYDGQDYGPWSSTRTVKVDATPPDTIVLTGPQGDIPNNNATFTWTGNDNRTGVSELQYAYRLTGPGQPGDWSGYSGGTSTSFSNLADGTFVFEVRARDLAGNVDGTPDTRSFFVDTTPPETTILSGPDNPTGDTAPIFIWTGSDTHTPPVQLEYSSRLANTAGFDTGWSAWSLDTMREFIGLTDGLYTFQVYARDGVGNEDASPANWDFHLDTAPPTGMLLINNGASQTASVVVLLNITGDDGPEGTGVSEMRLSSDGIHWAPWQPFVEFTTWQLPDVNRATWTVHLELKDLVGNVSSVITDDIYLNFYPDRPASANFQLGARGYLPGGSGSISGMYSLPGSAIGETIAGSGSTSNFYQIAGGYVPGALAQPNGPYPYEVFDMWQQALSAMGGSGSAASYQLFSIGGEGAVGGHTSVSANYSLRSGFWLGAITPPAPIFYDDTDYGVQYDGWRGGLDATAYGGGYRAASANSQRIIYKSQQPATSVTVVVCRGPNLGYAYILIPGQYQSPIDLYAPQAACDQAVIISGLAPLSHTIVFMATGQKNPASSGTEVRLDAFEVNGTRIDDNDPKVIYHSWSAVAAPWALGGSARLTTQPQAMIRFTFEGDAFTWKTITCPGCGRAAVIVDSMPAVTVDNYGSWNLNAEHSFTNLGSGTHTVQIYTLPTPNPGSSGTLITFDGYSVP